MTDLDRHHEIAIEIMEWLHSKYKSESPDDITSACQLVYSCLAETLKEFHAAEKEKEE